MINTIKLQPANPILRDCGIHCDKWRLPYDEILKELSFMKIHKPDVWLESIRTVSEVDFFFFCFVVLGLPVNNPFLLARCYELQDNTDRSSLYLWARGHWKALAYDTPIMTKDGWKKHGELQVGDYVIGSSGDFIKVIARTKNFTDSKQYEITFDKKYKIVCSSDHIWEVNAKSKKRVKGTKNKRIGREKKLVTADEVFEYGCGYDKKYSVDVLPVKYSEKELEIHPYVLGAWLGDGASAGGRIYGLDTELFDRIKELGYDIRDTSKDVTKSIRKIAVVLRSMNLKNNKHIPDNYKYSSYEQRMELVKGLMDTDGTIDDRCTCTFTNINKKLCDDLYEVLVSVGYKPNYRTHVGKFCDADYVFYNISFNARKENNPFYLKRKADKVYIGNKPKTRFITDIQPLIDGQYITNCIQVDSEDGIYLAGKEMIPTHNSTLKTFAHTIWILATRDTRIAIFSNSLKIAKPHFSLIKSTMESNELLKTVWDDVFWKDPKGNRDVKWSDDLGLFLKRNKLKEPSLGYYGLIDSMPTGLHFPRKITDDLVDLNNIGTYYMMEKVKEAYKMADNLGTTEGTIDDVIGTRYLFGDLYEYIEKTGMHRLSRIGAEVDELGDPKYDGIPVLLSREEIEKKKVIQGHLYHAQMLQTPLQQGSAAFKTDWIKFSDKIPDEGYYYIVGDPASNPEFSTNLRRKKDFTVLILIKACAGNKIYVVDMLRDRIGLKEKWEQLKIWHKMYDIANTGYEEYATQKDREFFNIRMEEERFYFKITPLKGSDKSKEQSILAMTDFFREGKIILPKTIMRLTKDRGVIDLVSEFVNEEYMKYPLTEFDDMLDALRRFLDEDLGLIYPNGIEELEDEPTYTYSVSPLDEGNNIECFWSDD